MSCWMVGFSLSRSSSKNWPLSTAPTCNPFGFLSAAPLSSERAPARPKPQLRSDGQMGTNALESRPPPPFVPRSPSVLRCDSPNARHGSEPNRGSFVPLLVSAGQWPYLRVAGEHLVLRGGRDGEHRVLLAVLHRHSAPVLPLNTTTTLGL